MTSHPERKPREGGSQQGSVLVASLLMVFVALVCLPVFYIDNRISRLEGGLLLSYYVLYIVYIIVQASNSSALSILNLVVVFFTPLTFIALVVFAVRSMRARKAR